MEEKKRVSPIKPLDFVRPKGDTSAIGIITEISSFMTTEGVCYQASIQWIGGSDKLHNAWWTENEIEVIDNLPVLLSKSLSHPFGNGEEYVDDCYPKYVPLS